jgi:hypothetical protein
MVDLADRRWASSDSVDWISDCYVHASCMAIVVVGAWARHKHNLVFCPDRVVLGPSGYQVLHLALSPGDHLVDAMGEAVEKTSGCLMAGGCQPDPVDCT